MHKAARLRYHAPFRKPIQVAHPAANLLESISGSHVPERRPEDTFFDTSTGDRYVPLLTLDPESEAYGDMALMTFADLAATYAQHPESKVALRDGRPCDSMQQGYAGPLYRRNVRLGDSIVVGKESTMFGDEVAQALGGNPEARTHVTLSPV